VNPQELHHLCNALQDGTALSIDFLGSCFTDQLRPPALGPHHITQYLHQGILATAPEAAGGSPGLHQSQGLPAAKLGDESSMASLSLAGDASQLSLTGVPSSIADASLRPEASMISAQTAGGAAAFHGRRSPSSLIYQDHVCNVSASAVASLCIAPLLIPADQLWPASTPNFGLV